MILVRANSLSKGYSGVRSELVKSLLDLLNNNVIPFIPEKGSVGSSGDLSPLSHLALALMGEGRAVEDGKVLDTKEVLNKKGYFVIGDFFPNDKADTKFLTSLFELIEDSHGAGQGKWKYGIKILRKP